MKTLKKIALVFCVVTAAALFVTAGCKDEPAAVHDDHAGHDHEAENTAAKLTSEAEKTVGDAKEIVASVEQTICPIMGKPIDKAIFVEYQGKKVYFCCDGCKEPFEKEPEKYIAKLPQFKTNE